MAHFLLALHSPNWVRSLRVDAVKIRTQSEPNLLRNIVETQNNHKPTDCSLCSRSCLKARVHPSFRPHCLFIVWLFFWFVLVPNGELVLSSHHLILRLGYIEDIVICILFLSLCFEKSP